jgi:WD40 repeat protein
MNSNQDSRPTPVNRDAIHQNPFPGLRPYDESEAIYFSGRTRQKFQLLKRISTTSFVSIIGDESVGKTSFVFGEILPELRKGFLARGRTNWKLISLKVDDKPLSSLARALSSSELTKGNEGREIDPDLSDQFEVILRQNKFGIMEIIEKFHLATDYNLLLFIDDLEALLTFSDPADSRIFVNRLLEVASQNVYPINILTASKSKLGSGFAGLQEFSELINKNQFILSPYDASEVGSLIETIMNSSNIEFRPKIIAYILAHYQEHAFDLSKFQHAMMRCVDQVKTESNSHTVGLVHLKSIGGLERSLEVQLESIHQSFNESQKTLCRKVFQSLSGMTKSGSKYLRPLLIQDLAAANDADENEVIHVVSAFANKNCGALSVFQPEEIQGRLEKLDHDITAEGSGLTSLSKITVTRAVIADSWARFSDWINAEWNASQTYLFIAEAAENKAHELEGEILKVNWEWYEKFEPRKNWAIRYHPSFDLAMDFLIRSKRIADEKIEIRKAEEKSRQQKADRNKVIVGVFLLVSALLLVYSGFQTKDAVIANQKASKAEERAQLSMALAETDSIMAAKDSERAKFAILKADESQKIADDAEQEAKEAVENAGTLKREAFALANSIRKKESKLKEASDKVERSKVLEEYLNILANTREYSEQAMKQMSRSEDKVLLFEAATLVKDAFQLFQNTKQERFTEISDSLSGLTLEAERRLYSSINSAIQSVNDDSKLNVIKGGVLVERVVSIEKGDAYGVYTVVSNEGSGKVYNVKIKKNAVESVSPVNWKKDNKEEPWAIKSYAVSNDKEYFIFSQYPTSDRSNPLELHKINGELINTKSTPDLLEQVYPIGGHDYFCVDQRANISFIKIDSGKISSIKPVYENQKELTAVNYDEQKNIGIISTKGRQIQVFNVSNTGSVDIILETKLSQIRSEISFIEIIPSNNWFAVGDRNGEIYFFDLKDGTYLFKTSSEHENIITSLAVSPSGDLLASGDRNGLISIWNLTDLQTYIRENKSTQYRPIRFNENIAIKDLSFVNNEWIVVVAKDQSLQIDEVGKVLFLPIQFELAGQELIKLTK